jgi:hydrogenase expression/formation protein HypE
MTSDAPSPGSPFGACPVPILRHEQVLMGHGSGGILTAQLIERIFLPAFGNPVLDRLDDQAVLEIPGSRVAFTTDSYVVTPLFFPGGDIGTLAVNGTVNDLAMGGARPLYLSVGFILEEGLPLEELQRIVASMKEAAAAAGVTVVTGDTKVVGKGSGDKVFVNTSGIGLVPPGVTISATRARPGDAILLSGTVGDHGMAIMALRESLGLGGSIRSDTAPLHGLVARLLEACPDVHVLRDPTRGGVAATWSEIASRAGVGIEIEEARVPVRDEVRGACEILGLDPFHVANEGKLVAFVPGAAADAALEALRGHPLGADAARVGSVVAEHPGLVVVRTSIGGSRVLERPYGEILPRIC